MQELRCSSECSTGRLQQPRNPTGTALDRCVWGQLTRLSALVSKVFREGLTAIRTRRGIRGRHGAGRWVTPQGRCPARGLACVQQCWGHQACPGHQAHQECPGCLGHQACPGPEGHQECPGPQRHQKCSGPWGHQECQEPQGHQVCPGHQGHQGVRDTRNVQGLRDIRTSGTPGPQGHQEYSVWRELLAPNLCSGGTGGEGRPLSAVQDLQPLLDPW